MTQGEDKPPETAASVSKTAASAMLEDWISIWESELAALAADREGRELWHSCVSQWATRAREAAAWMNAFDGIQGRPAAPGQQARSETAASAPDPRDETIAKLARRVEELERKLLSQQACAASDGGGRLP